MKIRLARCAAFALILAMGTLVPRSPAHAAEPKGPAVKPVLFLSAASMERLIAEFDYVVDSIEQPEVSKKIRELRESATQLKGMGRDRPVGLMLALDNVTPMLVGFVPIANRDDFIDTLEGHNLGVEETDENEYRIRGAPKPLFVVVRDRYAYVSDQPAALKKKFPDPEVHTKKLHGDYDLAVTAQLSVIPDYVRVFFTETVRAQMEQQRRALNAQENEPLDLSEKSRRLGEKMAMDGMSALAKEADQITVGWSVSRAERKALLDLTVTGMKRSKLADQLNSLQSIESKMSRFIDSAAPFRMTATFDYNASFREFLALTLESARDVALRAVKDKPENEQQAGRQIAAILVKVFDDDRLDFGMQIQGDPGSVVVLYGLTSPQADEVRKDLEALKGDTAADLEVIDQHRECPIYRTRTAANIDNDIYGPDTRLHVTVSKSVIWAAMGGDSAVGVLKKALDREAAEQPAAASRVPFEAVIRASQWKSLSGKLDNDVQAVLTKAFEKGDDQIRLELAGIENGVRLRATVGDAIIRVFGFAIEKTFEEQGLLGE